jgi:hypothetical protein
LEDGFRFVLPFLTSLLIIGTIAIYSALRSRRLDLQLVVSIPVLLLAYQVWAGGDPWPYWRMMTPGMPLLFVVFGSGVRELAQSLTKGRMVAMLLLIVGIACANRDFLGELTLVSSAYGVQLNKAGVERSLIIDALTRPNASIGVFEAGVVPYYTGRPSIDLSTGEDGAAFINVQFRFSRR